MLVPTEEIESCLEILESWCIKALTKESKEMLGQELTESQIKERFKSSLNTLEKGWISFRCKVNIAGKNAVKCWTPEKVKRSLPESWSSGFGFWRTPAPRIAEKPKSKTFLLKTGGYPKISMSTSLTKSNDL